MATRQLPKKSLGEGAGIDTLSESNHTPLALAAENGHEGVLKVLLAPHPMVWKTMA